MSLDENTELACESFWELNQYKKTVRRVEDGYELCQKLTQFVQERANIEKNYSDSLHKWSTKWSSFLEKGPEYGTVKSGWEAFTAEADELSEIHSTMRNKLIERVQTDVKNWQKEKYSKSTLSQRLKNAKEFEDKFHRAQKPWAKRYKSMQESKKAYYSACKQEKLLQTQLAAVKADGSALGDATKKLEDKVKKLEKEVSKTKEAYSAAMEELEKHKEAYKLHMSEVFQECQDFEKERLDFFKETFMQLHDSLNITREERLPLIYDKLCSNIDKVNTDADLDYWAQEYGDQMPMIWPQFEDYDAHSSGSRSSMLRVSKSHLNDTEHNDHREPRSHSPDPGAAPTTKADNSAAAAAAQPADNHKQTRADNHPAVPDRAVNSKSKTKLHSTISYDDTMNPFADSADQQQQQQQEHEQLAGDVKPTAMKDRHQANPFDNVINDPTYDDGAPGQPVRALYDFVGTEADELSFEAGDQFEKLDDEDEQGWCKGRKGGRTGLYPANYVEPV